MRFKRNTKIERGLEQIDMAPMIDMVFLLLIFFMLSSSFTFQSGINVKLPKAVTSDSLNDNSFVVSITSEDVLYFQGRVVTVKELQAELVKIKNLNAALMIKSDRRASMGRIVDIWDLCRQSGIEKINIATTKD